NLYPFAKTVADPGCSMADAVENIDIGGPTMVRAAAKNHRDVAIVVHSADYAQVIAEMDANQNSLQFDTRYDLAIKAFEHTAQYDGMIANYFGARLPQQTSKFPRTFNQQLLKKQDLRYGENSHQQAAFYVAAQPTEASVATATQ